MAFEPGDVVILKSGGPSMTVVSVSADEITCLWFGEEGELYREAVPAIALESVFSSADDEHEDEHHEDDEDEDDEEDEEDEEDEDDDEDDKPARKKR